MRCKDMPKEPRYCQIIICAKCKYPGGTMICRDGIYEHPNCTRPVNPEYLERIRREELKRSFEAGEIKCQLCDEHPAVAIIENKLNGKKLLVCKECFEHVTSLEKVADKYLAGGTS